MQEEPIASHKQLWPKPKKWILTYHISRSCTVYVQCGAGWLQGQNCENKDMWSRAGKMASLFHMEYSFHVP